MHRSDQRSRSAAEKVSVPDTHGVAVAAGGAIRGTHSGAVAGTSAHGPFM